MIGRRWIILTATSLAALLIYQCAFVCSETQAVLVTQFGRIVRELGTDAAQTGLAWKWPWQSVVRIDRRSLVSHVAPRDLLTADKKNLQMGLSLVWRVSNAKHFMESGNDTALAGERIAERAATEAAQVLARHELKELISTENNRLGFLALGREIATALNQTVRESFGVEVSGVMITQVAYPTEIRPAIFDQIRAERAQVASRIRAEAKSKTDEILAEAKRDRESAIAKARADAETIMAKADAEAIGILNEAHALDPKLYELIRMLKTYESLADDKTTVIISSGSPLWKLLWQGPTVDFSRDSPPPPDLGPAPEPIAPSPLAPKSEILEKPE